MNPIHRLPPVVRRILWKIVVCLVCAFAVIVALPLVMLAEALMAGWNCAVRELHFMWIFIKEES